METREIPFMDALSAIIDNRGKTAPTSDGGIPLIATNCISNDSLYPTFKDVRYVDDETYRTWFRGHPEPDDILFVNKGSPGRVCLVPNPVDFVIAQDMVSLRVNPEVTTPDFLLALLRSEGVQRQINNMHVGTLIPHFKKGDFQNLILKFPDLNTQRVVGSIYRSFSDKIELNRQMNRTLEQMARALFKSWFVDFDPVRAKMRGEQPEGMDAATAALFPSELVEVDGREVPKGWEWQPMENVCERITDGAHQSPASQLSGYPMASVKDMDEWGINLSSCRKISSEDYYALVRGDCKPEQNDVLIAKDGSFLKHVFPIESSVDVVLLSSIAILRPNLNKIDPFVLTLTLRDGETKARLVNVVSGAVLQRIVLRDFRKFQIVVPPIHIQKSFMAVLAGVKEQIYSNLAESARLAQLRDALLPRLLSGEVDVSGWEGME